MTQLEHLTMASRYCAKKQRERTMRQVSRAVMTALWSLIGLGMIKIYFF